MNWPTIIIALIIAVVFIAIIFNEINKKKKGKSSCSCGCGGCAMADVCHVKNKKK